MNPLLEGKIEKSKKVLKLASEMSKHYYQKPVIICYSGGKDSDVILHLALETLNPSEFEVLHSITTVDSPITNKYVNDVFRELQEMGIKCAKNIPMGSDGKPTNMWKLIPQRGLPPTRLARYCCAVLKETSTANRLAVLGVRSDESTGNWKDGESVFNWWIEKDRYETRGQVTINDYLKDQTDDFGLIIRKPGGENADKP